MFANRFIGLIKSLLKNFLNKAFYGVGSDLSFFPKIEK